MHFVKICDSIADKLDAQWQGHSYDDQNSSDKGELCEYFVKNVLYEALGDTYRTVRGGKIITSGGGMSKQLDIIVSSRYAIQFFASKGKYPVETVKSVLSITSSLTRSKLDDCLAEFASIPKTGYHFGSPKDLYSPKFLEKTQRIFEDLTPICVIFGFSGDINRSWVNHLNEWIAINKPHHSVIPTLVIVNKKAMIFKTIQRTEDKRLKLSYQYIDFAETGHAGEAFSRLFFELYNLAKEDLYLTPDYTYYFNADQETIAKELDNRNAAKK